MELTIVSLLESFIDHFLDYGFALCDHLFHDLVSFFWSPCIFEPLLLGSQLHCFLFLTLLIPVSEKIDLF
jgi:hypothetical protein